MFDLSAADAWGQGPDPAARSAAMGQLKAPDGVGGCIYRALPAEVRREALVDALAGKPSSRALQVAVSKVASRCTGRPSAKDDLPVVGAVTGAVRRSAAALALAQQFGVGQAALDQAWSTASANEKAAFYAAAGDYLTPGASLSPRTLDVAPFAAG